MAITSKSNGRKANLTVQRILSSAEALFVEHGFNGTSLRMITDKAGVNLAAVNYHFGSKEKLIEAIFQQRFTPYIDHVSHLLQGIEKDGQLQDLVIALIQPFQMLIAKDDPEHSISFIRLCGHMLTEQHTNLHNAIRTLANDALKQIFTQYHALHPHLSEEEMRWRLYFCIKIIFSAYNGIDVFALHQANPKHPHSFERISTFLIPYLSAALGAPPTATSYSTLSEKAVHIKEKHS